MAEWEDAETKAVKDTNKAYKEQLKLVNQIAAGIEEANRNAIRGYAGVLTTTGKIGGYMSNTE